MGNADCGRGLRQTEFCQPKGVPAELGPYCHWGCSETLVKLPIDRAAAPSTCERCCNVILPPTPKAAPRRDFAVSPYPEAVPRDLAVIRDLERELAEESQSVDRTAADLILSAPGLEGLLSAPDHVDCAPPPAETLCCTPPPAQALLYDAESPRVADQPPAARCAPLAAALLRDADSPREADQPWPPEPPEPPDPKVPDPDPWDPKVDLEPWDWRVDKDYSSAPVPLMQRLRALPCRPCRPEERISFAPHLGEEFLHLCFHNGCPAACDFLMRQACGGGERQISRANFPALEWSNPALGHALDPYNVCVDVSPAAHSTECRAVEPSRPAQH